MAIFSFGGEAACYNTVSGHTYSHSTDNTKYDDVLSRVAMVVTAGQSELELPFDQTGGVSEFYLHMSLAQESVSLGNYIDFQNEAGTQTQYRIQMQVDGSWKFQRYNGATFDDLGTTSSPMAVNELITADIHVVRDASTGSVEISRNNVSVLSLSAIDTSTPATVGQAHFIGLAAGTEKMYLSQVVVGDVSLVNYKMNTGNAIGDGTNTSWTGDYTAIDEAVLNENDFVETNLLNQIQTYVAGSIPAAYSTYNVKAVGIASRISNDSGSAVNDAQHVVRTGGANFTTTDLGVVKDGSVQSFRSIFEQNPDTAADWTVTEVNALEFGVKSV